MEEVEKINPYHAGNKETQVEEMFDNIAPRYDLMNGVMSLGMHQRWRDKGLAIATDILGKNNCEVKEILDVATGTGDVAFELARRFPTATVTGLDLSAGMMEVAARKAADLPDNLRNRVRFMQGDSLNLPFSSDSYNLVTVAYGVRNFADIRKGLAEMSRVLKPGGVLCIIELSEPSNRLIKLPYQIYTRLLIPAVGKKVSGDSRAYEYLPQSIAAVPQRDKMTKLMAEAGLVNCQWHSLTLGVVTIYVAEKKS